MEAVAEKLEIKHKVYKNIIEHVKEDAILSSNTSGIPLDDLYQFFQKILDLDF